MNQVTRKRVYKPEMKTEEEVRLTIRDLMAPPKLNKAQKQMVDSLMQKQRDIRARLRSLPAAVTSAPPKPEVIDSISKYFKASDTIKTEFTVLNAALDAHIQRAKRRWARRVKRGTVSKETIKELRRVGLLPRRRAAAA